MDVSLCEKTWPEVRDLVEQGTPVVVPIGAHEQHGSHLPLETDFRMADTVAHRAAERAAAAGAPSVVTPPIWTGYSPHHMEFAGSVTLRAETLLNLAVDVATSLWRHGFRKIFFLNGHGGNMNLLGSAVQALRFEHGVRAAAGSYWAFAADYIPEWRRSGPGGINHACEMEMSLMRHAHPAVTHPEHAGDGSWFPHSDFLAGDLAIGAPVGVAWSFGELSGDGTLGDPTKATADRGEELMEVVVDRVARFLTEFRQWDWENPKAI